MLFGLVGSKNDLSRSELKVLWPFFYINREQVKLLKLVQLVGDFLLVQVTTNRPVSTQCTIQPSQHAFWGVHIVISMWILWKPVQSCTVQRKMFTRSAEFTTLPLRLNGIIWVCAPILKPPRIQLKLPVQDYISICLSSLADWYLNTSIEFCLI
jgi:hypothetical protein